MGNTIVKTAFKTLLGIIIALLVAFAIASLGFPSSMASLFEDWGNYSLATGYASLSYNYTNDVNDLARCFEDSILAKNDNDIVNYGDKLIADEKFSDVCDKKNAQLGDVTSKTIDYAQYVYGSVACAKYRKGDKDGALDTAVKGIEGKTAFEERNALSQLSLQAILSKDKETASKLLEVLNEKFSGQTSDYLDAIKQELQKV